MNTNPSKQRQQFYRDYAVAADFYNLSRASCRILFFVSLFLVVGAGVVRILRLPRLGVSVLVKSICTCSRARNEPGSSVGPRLG